MQFNLKLIYICTHKQIKNTMPKLNIIQFENPPLTYSGLPHSHCMIDKTKNVNTQLKEYNLCNGDVISKGTNWEHLARVMEARQNKLNFKL